jgi:competence protein ComEC
VVISGLHVSIFSMLIGGLFYGILKRIPALTRRCPALLLASLFGFVASAFYVALSGCGIPAQRTLIMLTVVLVALWTGRLNRPFRAWVWALFFVTLHDPWSPLANGFWLSFGAVGWLLFALSGRATPRLTDETPRTQKIMHTIFAGAYTQWIVTLGLMPLLLAIFQQFSLISFPANLIAIPVTTFVVVPLTLLSMIPGLSILWEMAYEVIDLLMRLLTALSQLPIAVWQQHDAPAWTIVAGLLGVMWLLSPRGVPMRGMGLLWCVPLFVVTPPAPSPPGFQATVLDVGQGLAVFVRTQNHRLLYDTGPHYSELSDAGDRVVIPFLRHLAVNKLDTLIISHNDSDHAGGAKSVLQHYPVDQLIVSEDHPYLNHTDYCREGLQWTWDGVSFAVLSPREETLRQNKNDNSCVLKIESPLGSLLLTGDIGADVENQLIQYYRDELDSSIIVAPHHGSRHSSSASFVKEVNPWHTVFSSGYLNRYQHPRQEIVARYQNVISDVWRTDQSGAITFNVNEKGIEVLPYRQVNRRYWY